MVVLSSDRAQELCVDNEWSTGLKPTVGRGGNGDDDSMQDDDDEGEVFEEEEEEEEEEQQHPFQENHVDVTNWKDLLNRIVTPPLPRES